MPGKPSWINGTIGVDIFFALSGWLITSMILDEISRNGKFDIAGFYIRRAFRIMPLYYLTLVIYIIAAILVMKLKHDPEDWNQLSIAIPWYVAFNSEYRPFSAGDIAGHSWTLGIEEKFYVIWPLILVISRSRTVLALLLSLCASFCLVYLADFRTGPIRGYLGLGFGAALATAVAYWPALAHSLRHVWIAPLAVLAIAALHWLSIVSPSAGWNVGVSFISAFLVANLWHSREGIVARGLAWRPLAFAGKLTFGMYLIHVLVINAVVKIILAKMNLDPGFWLELILVYFCSIAICYVAFTIVEGPCIRAGRAIAKARLARSGV